MRLLGLELLIAVFDNNVYKAERYGNIIPIQSDPVLLFRSTHQPGHRVQFRWIEDDWEKHAFLYRVVSVDER